MTHNERVLQLLSDGAPHSHHEIYDLHVVAHSRISDLRKRGYEIMQWREGELYLYRLNGILDEPGAIATGTNSPDAASSSIDRTVTPAPRLVEGSPSPVASSTPSEATGQLFALDPYSRRVDDEVWCAAWAVGE